MAKKSFCSFRCALRHDQHLSSSLVSSKCITRIKTRKDLASFKKSVSSFKRTKATTGDVGVSLITLWERHRSKVARTLFTSNQNNKTGQLINAVTTFIGVTIVLDELLVSDQK